MPSVIVKTICKPTENPDKVKKSMLNIFPDLQIERKEEELIGTTESTEMLEKLLREQQIRSAARSIFLNCVEGDKLEFRLNKQVAFVGKVSFAERSPLGDIEVTIEDERLLDLIDILAPDLGD
ncbi:MAG: hypothetical protein JSV43_04635, partial [Methanobacteriota archaeon]